MAKTIQTSTSEADIQSRIQSVANAKARQTAISTEATKSGSTETPVVSDTPKVTQTAKAMPTATPINITKTNIIPQTTQQAQKIDVKNLLWTATSPLKKAATPDLLTKKTEDKTPVPWSVISAANATWWGVEETVNKTILNQFTDWFKETPEKVTNKVWDFFKWPVVEYWTAFERMINDTEYWVAWLADVIEKSLWWEWWFKQAFQEQQWWHWDVYWEESDIKASKSYEQDIQAQNVSRDVSDYIWNVTWNKEMSNMIWNVVWKVTASLKDPEQIASVAWYMTPAIIMQWATWWWFLANTSIWLPSQSTQVYKDFAEDKELSSQFTDNQLFGISTWLWTILSMVETFWDALWDMPWAKAMSRNIRNAFTKSLKKPIAEWLTKEITDVVDKNLIKDVKQPVLNALKKWYLWSIWEWLEEVTQDTLQTEWARALGSKREWMSLEQMLTTYFTAKWMGLFISWPWAALNIKNNSDLRNQYEEFSKAVDKISPWINEDTKMAFFSAMITSQQNDANLSEKKVKGYEEQTTKLYEERSMLEQRLKQADNDEVRAKINWMIEQTDNKIKEIDKKINQWKNTEEAINKYLEENKAQETKEEELPAVKQEIQMPSEMGGENLSEQTMKTSEDKSVVDSTPIEDMDNNKILDARKFRLVNKPQTPQERKRQKDIENEMEIRMNNYKLPDSTKKALEDLTFDVDNMSIWEAKAVIKELDRLKNNAREEKRYDDGNNYTHLKRKVQDKLKDLLRMDEERAEAKTEQRDKENILPETPIDDKDFFDKWSNKININKYALKVFLLDRKYIPWLKWIKVSWVEDLSESEIMEVAKNAATVAWILWIDFNKVLDLANVEFSVLNLKWEDVKWTEDVSGKLYLEASKYYDILKMAIILKDTWPSVFWHELMHLLDKEYLYRNGKLWTGGDNISRASILKDASFKTYNVPYLWYKFDDKDYWDTSREILARFAEQYIAKQVDEREYQALTWRDFYWSDKEFNKLVPKFEKIIAKFSEFMLDKWDKVNYPEIMRKIAEIQYKQTQFSLGTETEMVNSLMEMKEAYDDIVAEISKIKDETLKLELESVASTLYSNYEMLNNMKEEYLQKQKTTPEQQDTIDNITETVVQNPPQNPQTIIYWLPYFWWSNIEDWIWDIAEWWKWEKIWKSYAKEEDIIKIRKRKNKIKNFKKELSQTWKDVFTPTISRIYNISPRVAWRLATMETQTAINIHRYRMKAKWFVETLWSLKWNKALEVKMALLDYWALASEQWENIEQYKKEEVAKLKEVLLRNWFKEQDINDMFSVLDDIWQQYKDAWLSVNLTDMYFPRVVKDYEWLIDYMNRVSGNDIKVNKVSLMIKIRNIQSDPNMTDEEKERRIRNAISMEFKQPWTTSQHWKERKMWKLSDWWEWIFAYYESPIESIDHYIVTMTNAIQRQLFLWWMKEDANITEWDILNQSTAESVSTIIWKLVEQWKINENDIEELQKSILAVLNKAKSPKAVTAIKDITYISTITNFLSAINQLDDLWMVLLKDRSWLKHIVKTIFWKAWIKYDDIWLDDAYEMFREEWSITNWLFQKSFFNMFDRLGKTSFVNTAWESMIHQSKNEKTRKYLYARLQAMYWTESADRMMERIDSWSYLNEEWQIDIEILRDLLYQLWSTQPIYTSAMSTTYLNHPWARLAYALSSFTLKRIDWLIQWSKEVYKQNWWWAKGRVAAWAWLMWVSVFLAMFWAAIWDVWDLLKGKKEETFLWNFINNWIDEALKSWWSDMLDSWLKIWDLSEYDLKTYKSQWIWWVLSSKIKPFIFDLGKDITEAITEHNEDEITDLAKYVPIFWKLVYYWCWSDLNKSTKSEKSEWNWDMDIDWDFWDLTDTWDWEDDEEWDFS